MLSLYNLKLAKLLTAVENEDYYKPVSVTNF